MMTSVYLPSHPLFSITSYLILNIHLSPKHSLDSIGTPVATLKLLEQELNKKVGRKIKAAVESNRL